MQVLFEYQDLWSIVEIGFAKPEIGMQRQDVTSINLWIL